MTRRLRRAAALIAVGLAARARPAGAQARPFVFTVTTGAPSEQNAWTVQYDAGYGEQTASSLSYGGLEQRVSVQGALGRGFTVRGLFGVGMSADAGTGTQSTQEAELLKDVVAKPDGTSLALGFGVRREWEGEATLLGRIAWGRVFDRSSLFGNLVVEKSLTAGRDDVDLILTAGWIQRVGDSISLGLEAVGQDIEGLWEADEAEGGARIFVGPTLHYAVTGQPFYLQLCGGPVVYASHSPRTSDAQRPLGAGGYTVRLAIGYAF